MSSSVSHRRWMLPVVAEVLRRPELWAESARTVRRLARRNWWRSWPPIPTPPAAYLRFRVETNVGGGVGRGTGAQGPAAADVIAYLRWCRNNRSLLGASA